MRKVTVFGGAKPQPGDVAYQEAYNLGNLLAKAGWSVLTGGYIGTMEAVSRGASEAGGHVIGITCDEIEKWRPMAPNRWVKEEWRFPSLNERMQKLIDGCDAAIALPGGVGTLAEIVMMWNQLIIAAITPRPLVIIGLNWKRVFDQLLDSQGIYIPEKDQKWLCFVNDIQSAVQGVEKIWSKIEGC